MDALSLFEDCRIVPVVTFSDAADAVPAALALAEAGLGAIEITLRTAAGLDAIAAVSAGVDGLLVGAGSVRTIEQLGQVKHAGAAFAVCPGFSSRLLDEADALDMPFVPGGATAAEMLQLWERGYVLQKFFPAESLGGTKTIRALTAPLPEIRFFPTGGINAERLPDYLAIDAVVCVGGSWFMDPEVMEARDWPELTRLARQALAAAS